MVIIPIIQIGGVSSPMIESEVYTLQLGDNQPKLAFIAKKAEPIKNVTIVYYGDFVVWVDPSAASLGHILVRSYQPLFVSPNMPDAHNEHYWNEAIVDALFAPSTSHIFNNPQAKNPKGRSIYTPEFSRYLESTFPERDAMDFSRAALNRMADQIRKFRGIPDPKEEAINKELKELRQRLAKKKKKKPQY